MQFDAFLNVAWLSLGLVALCLTSRVAFRRDRPTRAPRWLLLVGVGLIIAALFPYISASDDVLRIDGSQQLEQTAGHHDGTKAPKNSPRDNLLRLYETMDAPLVCQVACLTLTFCFVAFVFSYGVRGVDRDTPGFAGRSPPYLVSI